jgi:8-oxo-dGTP pyrophosphatase MutT (NUDIX family)
MPLRDVRHQAAIVRDHNILLLRVDDHDQATSYWLLPGGGSEDGESGENCVCREVREEAGVDVTVSRTLFEHILEPNHLYERVRTYLCTVAPDAVPLPGHEPEVYWSTTIVETGWFDLRSTGGWPPELLGNERTMLWLERIRAALGYR